MTIETGGFPTPGNLVKTEYLIGSNGGSGCKRVMPCWSVVLRDSPLGIDGLIISDKELVNASTRFASKATGKYMDVASFKPGKFEKTIIVGGGNKKPLETWFVVLTKNGVIKTGYMFSNSEIEAIVSRTKRIPATVKRLGVFQMVALCTNAFFKKIGRKRKG